MDLDKQIAPRSIKHYAHLLLAIETLKDLTATQCDDGNWNYDSYMHGMANGMILALSLLDGCDPDYLDPPEQWGKDEKLSAVVKEAI